MPPLAATLPSAETVSYLVNLAAVVSLACGVGLLAARACRPGSAPLRHGILVWTLAWILLSPAAVWLAQQHGLALVRVTLSSSPGVGEAAKADQAAPATAASAPARLASAAVAETAPPPLAPRLAPSSETSRSAAGGSGLSVSVEKPSRAPTWWQVAGSIAAVLWAGGAAVGLLCLGWGCVALARFCRRLAPLPDRRHESVVRRAAEALGLREPPPVFLSRSVSVPVSIGLLRPAIVLPEPMTRQTDDRQLQAVLLHEMAHIARRDRWVGLGQRVAAVLFWWNPLVRRVGDQISELREEICDNHVVVIQGEGQRLAHILVELAAGTTIRPPLPSTVGVLEPKLTGLSARVARLVDKERNMETRMNLRSKVLVFACGTAVLLGMVSVGGLRLAYAQPAVEAAAADQPATLVASGAAKASDPAGAAQAEKTGVASGPLMLDIARFYNLGKFDAQVLAPFFGRQVIDGLPFQADGQARLWGQTVAERNPKAPLPETFKGICIGRTLDELHLIHYTMWPDVEGETVAYISLNFADGTKSIFPMGYGAQVRDWYFLPSYDKDLPTDPNTKICWRRPPLQFKAPVRLFKSKLVNPFPQKVVATMDVVSAHNLASYMLLAATVANRDPSRPITPPVPAAEPPHKFDGKVAVQAVDDATGKAIEGALVEPSVDVLEEWLVGAPFYTSAAGKGTIRYPIKHTSRIAASVKKEGYLPQWEDWDSKIPKTFTFRLTLAKKAATAQGRSLVDQLQKWLSPPGKSSVPSADLSKKPSPPAASPVPAEKPKLSVELEKFGPREYTLPGGKTMTSGGSIGTVISSGDPHAVEAAQRHHEEMKELIADKKYSFVRTFADLNGEKQYVYRFTFADGSQQNTNFSMRLEDVSSWDDYRRKTEERQRQQHEQINKAIAAGKFRLINLEVMQIQICRDVEANEKFRVQRIALPGGKEIALFTPAEAAEKPQTILQTRRETSWQDHLQAIREGKRELLSLETVKSYTYEMTLEDGSKTMFRYGGGEPLKKPEKQEP